MLSARLAALPGWSLLVLCECRQHPVHLPLAPIAADRGGRTMLKTVLDQLRCQYCGERPTRVDEVQGDPFGGRPWRVKRKRWGDDGAGFELTIGAAADPAAMRPGW